MNSCLLGWTTPSLGGCRNDNTNTIELPSIKRKTGETKRGCHKKLIHRCRQSGGSGIDIFHHQWIGVSWNMGAKL